MMPGSVTGGRITGIVHVQKNISNAMRPANVIVIIVAREFFLASKVADIAYTLFIQNYILNKTG
jgi:hypothetical protein